MKNDNELNGYYAERNKAWYEKLVNAGDVWVEVSWYNTDDERAYPEVENLDGIRFSLNEQDAYDLVYGDANIYDHIEDFEGVVQASIDSYDEYYEDAVEKWNAKWGNERTRDDYPYLASVQFAIYADDERLFWNTYRFVED